MGAMIPTAATIFATLALASTVQATEPPDPNVHAYSDTIAAQTCAQRGYRFMVRLVPGRPEVLCLESNVGIEKRVVDVRELLARRAP